MLDDAEGAGEASTPTVIDSLSCLPELRLGDRRDAFVWLGRGHETRQTGALVGSLCVSALSVLTQRHLVADVLALVYVCRKKGDTTRSVSRGIGWSAAFAAEWQDTKIIQ